MFFRLRGKLANNKGYLHGTIRVYRYILQDYFKENGFDLKFRIKRKLSETILNIKKEHFVKNQGNVKAPLMYKDLKHIINVMPDAYPLKNLQVSLFLLAANTAQRANTCVSVNFDDAVVRKEVSGKIKSVDITFNVTKRRKTNANIRKIIERNDDDPQICFVLAFEK